MRLEQLLYCTEVANCKTMSQASKKLFMTQPSLSTAILNLEEELGFQIFKRSTHGVTLTDKGELLLEKAEIIADQIEAIKNLSVNDEAIIRNVTIAAVPTVCNAITAELIREVQKERSNINLSIVELRPDKIIASLIDGQADVIVGSYAESIKGNIYNEAAKYNLMVEPIYEDQMYAFLGRNDPKARQNMVTMEELQEDTQAFFSDRVLMEADEGSPKTSEISKNYYSFSDKSSIKKVVASGLAYAILPSSMAYDDIYIDSGWIKALPIADADVTMTIYLAYKYTSHQNAENQLIIDIIRRLYEKVDQKMKSGRKSAASNVNNRLLVY